NDPVKLKLQADLEICFAEGKRFYNARPSMTGAELYGFVEAFITEKGWQISRQGHCGHLIGEFPHELKLGENALNYIWLENPDPLDLVDGLGQKRYWILEIHIVNTDGAFGGFYEDLLNL